MMHFDRKHYSNETLVQLYKALLKPRLIEEKMLVLLRQNKISKWFSGIGQEAVSVGVTEALQADEYILPLHRNLGVFTSRDIPLRRLFAQFQGKKLGFTKGRDRSFHFVSKEHHIFGMISHLGPQLTVANGIALASNLAKKNKVTLAFTGDGGASEGDFHEALNVAAVWDLPVIFLVENNGYGLSTPINEQYKCDSFVEKGPAYGMEAYKIDGNNVLEVYDFIKTKAEELRQNPRPILVEAVTFRMRGHEEASGTKYVPQQLFDMWVQKDPLENFELFLIRENIIDDKIVADLHKDIKKEIDQAWEQANSEPMVESTIEDELNDVYYPYNGNIVLAQGNTKQEVRFIDAISDGLIEAMENFPNLILMGQDIAEYGGVFKVTEGFVDRFGKQRIRNTPLCESAIIGAGLGLSIEGHKSVVEIQFADFVSMGFNQVVNNLAKIHYRTGINADVVLRLPTGAGTAAGPFHSQSTEAWFFHTPGLKIVYPSNPYDAKGLLLAAIGDPNPYLYFEHKYLYRTLIGEVPVGYYTTPIGKAAYASRGDEITIVTYGMGVHWALEVVKEMEISADVIDLRTLLPWDKDTVFESVRKNGKVLVLNEDTQTGSIASEIAAEIAENCFANLDAPVTRLGALDTPIPFSSSLENQFLPKSRLKEKIKALIEF